MAKKTIDNNIDLGSIYVRTPQKNFIISEVVPCELVMAPFFSRIWLTGVKNPKSEADKLEAASH